ncbi:hypothetical protein MA9V2_173 [Chryseobacterium phage MA9V-2]|nr:hypothetical protein MA9V2_173 [Chryseobacterium phage MA9V-2]
MKHLFNVQLTNNRVLPVYKAANLRQLYVNLSHFQNIVGADIETLVNAFNKEREHNFELVKSKSKLQSNVSDDLIKSATKPFTVAKLQICDSHAQYGYYGIDAFYQMHDELSIILNGINYVSVQLAQLFFDNKDAFILADVVYSILNNEPIALDVKINDAQVWYFPQHKQFYITEQDFNRGVNGNIELPNNFDNEMLLRVAEGNACYYRYDGTSNPASTMMSEMVKLTRAPGKPGEWKEWTRYVAVSLLTAFTFDYRDMPAYKTKFMTDLHNAAHELSHFVVDNVQLSEFNKIHGITDFINFVKLRTGGMKFHALRGHDNTLNVFFNDKQSGDLVHLTKPFKNWSEFKKAHATDFVERMLDRAPSIFVTADSLKITMQHGRVKDVENWNAAYGPVDSIVSTTGTVKFANANDVVSKMTPEQVINTLSQQ